VLTEDEMTKALMVFNAHYLPLAPDPAYSMAKYHVGLRFPLPVIINNDEDWLVNPGRMQLLAGGFDEAWLPFMDQKPVGANIPKDKDMTAAVDTFLADNPTLLGQGVGLSAKIRTNPTEALPFLKSLFARDGMGHELAISIVNNLVIHQAGMLASLKDGYEIVGLLYSEINNYTGGLSEDLQKQKERANKVLGPFGVPAMTLERDSVRPKDTGVLTAGVETSKVTFTGLPPGFEAIPTARAVANSGGHAHHSNARPGGTFTPARKQTGRTNTAEFVYQSPKPGGEVVISLAVGGKTIEETIRVEVPGFVELPASPNYDLTGSTTQHPSPNNHWGTPNTIQHLQDIAAEWEAYKTDNNHPTWPRIGYNDISLPMGGIFDISGVWSSPHSEHRIGRNVDFRLGYTATQRTVMRNIINSNGAYSIYDEGDHWHLRFPD